MRAVFVGSSATAIKHAKAVCRFLQTLGITPMPWWEQFPPGSVTIEAIESVLERVCGAVLLATPDDVRISKGNSQHVSRDNVILELGMFTARLGRHSVALLKYNDVILPTDLTGFTHVKMGAFEPDKDVRSIGATARTHLTTWAGGLCALTEGIPHTLVVNGYTGMWRVVVSFSRWWDMPIEAPNFVQMDGIAHIFLPASSSGGSGSMTSQIDAVLANPQCSMRVRSVQTIELVSADTEGNLKLVNNIFNREVMEVSGTPPAEGGFQQRAGGPLKYTTLLSPVPGRPRVLTGRTELVVGDRIHSAGDLCIEKLS
jgi:hypothetical protein